MSTDDVPELTLPKKVRYLVVGQGLAGTLIGYRLEQAGHDVHYQDAPEQRAASSVAAGIVNPITGRRFVKSWRIDELLPAARALYGDLESELRVRIWYDIPLVRTLFNQADENDWLARSGDRGYGPYLDDAPELGRIPELTHPAFAYAGVRQSARVDLERLTAAYRTRLRQAGRITETVLDYADLRPGPDGVSWDTADRRHRFDRVIFCEGWRSRFNPWFGHLPAEGNKGEVLIVRTQAPVLERMFKHRIFLVPRPDGTYWAGATSENGFGEELPSSPKRDYLEQRLREVLRVPFTIEDHMAAVRPTVADRRPVIGPHPEHDRLWIFNGLGTKGASLAPLVSEWLLSALTDGAPCPPEVHLNRFPE